MRFILPKVRKCTAKKIDQSIPDETKLETLISVFSPFRNLDKSMTGKHIASNIKSYSTTYGIVAMLGCTVSVAAL